MKTVKIQTLSLLNFKGLREETFRFEQNTIVSGRNGLGKSTIVDAFLWLFFGKDSKGSTTFGIKTYDQSGDIIPQLSHEVSAVLLVDDETVTLKKTLTEKWVKPHGSTQKVFQGNETSYEVNNVPYKAKEYQAYIANILPESSFRAVTNPYYFTSLPWQDQKSLLITIAGGITQEEITNGDQVFAKLLADIAGKDIELYRREIVAKKNKCKAEADTLEPRIDEVKRSFPITPDKDIDGKELDEIAAASSDNNAKIFDLQEEVKKIDASLADSSKKFDAENETRQRFIDNKATLTQRLSDITAKITNEATTEYSHLISSRNIILTSNQSIERDIATAEINRQKLVDDKTRQENIRQQLRAEIDKIDAETYSPESTICPTCGQPLPEEQLQEAENRWNDSKAERRKAIIAKGVAAKNESERLSALIVEADNNMADLRKRIQQVPAEPERPHVNYESDLRYIQVRNEIENIDRQIAALKPANAADNTDLVNRKAALNLRIDELRAANEQLTSRANAIHATHTSYDTQVNRLNERIKELEQMLRDLNQQIADLEQREDLITAYKQREVSVLENKINNKFHICRWRFYRPLINGGMEETCECTVNGVPFSDVNRASQINAGIDIINALQAFYNFSAPIFIDNAESVNTFHPTVAQIIALYVSEEKSLTFKYI